MTDPNFFMCLLGMACIIKITMELTQCLSLEMCSVYFFNRVPLGKTVIRTNTIYEIGSV
jgi:hypothetical protein